MREGRGGEASPGRPRPDPAGGAESPGTTPKSGDPEGGIAAYLVRGGIWALAGRAGSAVLGLGLTLALARILPPDDLGAYFLAASVVSFFGILSCLGLDYAVLRVVADARARGRFRSARRAMVRGLLIATAGGAFFAVAYAGVVGPWLAEALFRSPVLVAVVGPTAIWIALAALQNVLANTLRGLEDIRGWALVGGVVPGGLALVLVVAAGLLIPAPTLVSLLPLVVLAAGVNVSVGLVMALRRRNPDPSDDSDVAPGELLAQAWPLLVFNLATYFVANADIWILGALLSDEEVAVYAAAVRLVLVASVGLRILNVFLAPLVARLHVAGQRARLEELLRTTAALAAWPALVLLVVLAVFGRPVLSGLFGTFYGAGWAVLALRSAGQAADVLGGSSGITLVMTGHQRTLMVLSLAAGVVSVLGAILLVPAAGMEGVAFAFAAGMLLQQGSMVWAARRLAGVWTHAYPATPARLYRRARALLSEDAWVRP